jgi:hypothetical protein
MPRPKRVSSTRQSAFHTRRPSTSCWLPVGALIAQQTFFSELVADNPLMSALEPASGLLGKEYAKETEAASDYHLHLRATGVRGDGEITEGLWP